MPAAGMPVPGRKLSVIEMKRIRLGRTRHGGLLLLALLASGAGADCATFEIVGDGITLPLGGQTGNPEAGRRVAAERQRGDCSICHQLPLPNDHFHGNVGPDLTAISTRLTPAQIRLRVAANRQMNPESVMPDYCSSRGRHEVAGPYAGEPILTDQEIEDVVAWLSSLDGSAP